MEISDRDIRELAADAPAQNDEDAVHVPRPEETADHYITATRSLAEIQARRAVDEQEQVEHRAAELDRWHTDDVRREALGIRAEVRDLTADPVAAGR